MNYLKIYNSIIGKAKSENRKKKENIYYESHHILPKCLGGVDRQCNRVLLTAREHFICHKLLHYTYHNNTKLAHAYLMMCYPKSSDQQRDYRISSREYARLKALRKQLTIKIHKGKIVSDVTRKRLSDSNKNQKKIECPWCHKIMNISHSHKYHFDKCDQHPIFGEENKIKRKFSEESRKKMGKSRIGIKLSEEHRAKISLANKCKVISEETKIKQRNTKLGKIFTEQHKQNLRLSHVGRIVSEETKEKRRQQWKEIEDIKCPYCDIVGRGGVMIQYHFENCKHNPNYIPQIKEIVTCPHCGKEGKKGRGMKRYHFDNCKYKNI